MLTSRDEAQLTGEWSWLHEQPAHQDRPRPWRRSPKRQPRAAPRSLPPICPRPPCGHCTPLPSGPESHQLSGSLHGFRPHCLERQPNPAEPPSSAPPLTSPCLQPFIPQTLPPPGRRLSPNISPKKPPFSDHRKLKRSFRPSWPPQEDRHHLGARSPEQPIHIKVPWPFLRSPRILCHCPKDAIIPQLLHQRSHGSPGVRQLPHTAHAGASPALRQAAAGASGQPRHGP